MAQSSARLEASPADLVAEFDRLRGELERRDLYIHDLQATELHRLRVELAQRDTYIHQLHLAGEASQRRINQLHSDLENFVHWLWAAEDERNLLKGRIAELTQREPKTLASSLHSLLGEKKKPAPSIAVLATAADVPPAPFTYHFKRSPFQVYRTPTFTLEGWAFPQDGRPVTALRARVDDRVFFGTYGLDEPAVIAHHGPQENNPKPGFKIVVETPAGRHRLSLEAKLGGSDWVSILSIPIWVQPSP